MDKGSDPLRALWFPARDTSPAPGPAQAFGATRGGRKTGPLAFEQSQKVSTS